MAKKVIDTLQKQKRHYYTKSDEILNPPDLIAHQNQSFQWFVDEGLGELLGERVVDVVVAHHEREVGGVPSASATKGPPR